MRLQSRSLQSNNVARNICQTSRKGLLVTRKCVRLITRSVEVDSKTQASTGSQASDGKTDIYIGFQKDDLAPRSGRQGRIVRDDPAKYPGRDELAGGWAGGEVGLKAWAEANAPAPEDLKKLKSKPSREPKPISNGRDEIYVGFTKDEIDAKNSGRKGRVLKDDAKKYPGRTELTGGFAGGELGLRKFVEVGDVPIDLTPGGRRQGQSPLVIALGLSIIATVGGLLLNDVSDLGEEAFTGSTGVNPAAALSGLDDNTKLLLEAGVLLFGIAGTLGAACAIFRGVANSFKETAARIATLSVFWIAVFIAAKFVLEAP